MSQFDICEIVKCEIKDQGNIILLYCSFIVSDIYDRQDHHSTAQTQLINCK